MDYTARRKIDFGATLHRLRVLLAVFGVVVATGCGLQPVRSAEPHIYPRHTREHFRHNMAASIRPNHPAIVPVANAIRAVTSDPLEQIVMVNDVTHLLVDYDEDLRVYGVEEYHATLDEMIARRRQSGWLYLRDDCDGRAVFAAHLLAALGIPWRLEASYWKEHAWVVARVNGKNYDLLDLRKDSAETNRFAYKAIGHLFVRESVRPPPFAWRRAWAARTGHNLGTGLTLGLLALDSTQDAEHERFSMDWTSRSPSGQLSPVDDRALGVTIAGFPYGEPLHVAAIADVPRAPRQAQSTALGVATKSVNTRGR